MRPKPWKRFCGNGFRGLYYKVLLAKSEMLNRDKWVYLGLGIVTRDWGIIKMN